MYTAFDKDAARREVAVVRQLGDLLSGSPGYRQMGPSARRELDEALAKITGYLAPSAEAPRLADQLAMDIRERQRQAAGASGPGTSAPSPTSNGKASGVPSAPSSSGAPASGGAVSRVGDVARATLNAINFPEFVASLIQGTFQAIVDASIQQMEAYAELLKNVATTVDRFMQDNVSDGMARDYLADQYGGVLARNTAGGTPRLQVRQEASELPSFFKDLGFDTPQQIDDRALDEVIVPATRQHLADRRQQTLATMVLMGINRVIVKDGEINAKLMFHIDASETSQIKFDENKVTNGNMSGYAGRNPFGASALMVNTASINAQSALNVRADLTGQVTVRFATETFPLERFADSAAIQLINQNARVPAAAPAPNQAAVSNPAAQPAPAAPTAPTPARVVQPVAAPGAPPATPISQGLALDDPWAPKARGLT